MNTTYGEVFDPIRPLVRGYTVDDFDAPPLVEVKVDLVPSDGASTLPVGDKGPVGDRGEPALPMTFAGYVDDDDAIPDESILGLYDEGKVWANTTTGSFWLWDGDSFMEIPDGLGVPGPVGPPGSISVGTTTTSPAGGVADAEAVGSPLDRKLNLVLPRGPKGPDGDVGPSGPIRQAVDYANGTAPNDGDILVWNELTAKFAPTTPKKMVGPFTLINSDFSFTSTTAASAVVGTLQIPAQPFKYQFMITGLLSINCASSSGFFYAQVVPQSTAGLAVARGHRDIGPGVRSCAMLPYSGSKVSPGTTVGEMPAGVAQTLNVQVFRGPTSVAYNVASDVGNNIQVWLIPV